MLNTHLSALLAILPVVLGIQQCYVCVGGEGSREVEHQFPREHLPSCQRGHQPPPKTCPPKYKGCLTQYKGERVTRMCAELKLSVCQEVNEVKYCYCQGQLCNKEDRPPSSGETDNNGGTSDDEDESEGSGTGDTTMVVGSTELHSISAQETTTKPAADPNKAFTNQNSTYMQIVISVVAVFCLRAIL